MEAGNVEQGQVGRFCQPDLGVYSSHMSSMIGYNKKKIRVKSSLQD